MKKKTALKASVLAAGAVVGSLWLFATESAPDHKAVLIPTDQAERIDDVEAVAVEPGGGGGKDRSKLAKSPVLKNLGQSEPTTVERFPNMASPRCVAPSQPFDLTVWLSTETTEHIAALQAGLAGPTGRLRMALIGPAPWAIDVTLLAAGFKVEGPPQGRLTLPAQGDSSKARFQLTPQSVGKKTLYAILNDARGQQLGIISHTVQVQEGAQACGTERSAAGAVALTGTRPPDLTIMLQEDPHTGRAEVYARSPHFVERRSQQPDIDLRALRAHVNQKLRTIVGERGARRRATDAPADPRAKLRSLGKRIYQQLSTPQLREMLQAVAAKVDEPTLLVVSNTPDVPFELMLPSPLTIKGRPARFLGTDFVMARANLGKRSSALAQAPPQTVDLSSENPLLGLVVPQYAGVKTLPAQAREVATIQRFSKTPPVALPGTRALTAAIERSRPSIIHFAGHGEIHAPESPAPEFRLMLEDGPLTLDEWKDASDWGTYRPLLFLNACSLGQSASTAGFADGWGPALLEAGAGGVIGGLWALGDQGAAQFATRFYDALKTQPKIAYALRRAREGYYETGDPTALAYVLYGDPHLRLASTSPSVSSVFATRPEPSLADALSGTDTATQRGPRYTVRLGPLRAKADARRPPALARAIQRQKSRLQRCLRRHQEALAGAKGALEFDLALRPSGELTATLRPASWLKVPAVQRCLVGTFAKVRTPRETTARKASFKVRLEVQLESAKR